MSRSIIFSIIMLLNTWWRHHWTRKKCEVCNFCYWSGNCFFFFTLLVSIVIYI